MHPQNPFEPHASPEHESNVDVYLQTGQGGGASLSVPTSAFYIENAILVFHLSNLPYVSLFRGVRHHGPL